MLPPTISIITATYNAADHLPKLIDSLKNQTDHDFEWIIADGGSSDKTLDILKKISELNIVISSQPDFGIYDAMNRAIQHATGEYYLVIGSDDYFYPSAIESFRKEASKTNADIISAIVDTSKGPINIHEGMGWLYGAKAYTTAHSVGTLIRRSLHEEFGFYSKQLPITADLLFIKQVCESDKITRHSAKFTSGFFSSHGISNIETLNTLVGGLQVQIMTKENKLIQIFIFLMRILKNINKI